LAADEGNPQQTNYNKKEPGIPLNRSKIKLDDHRTYLNHQQSDRGTSGQLAAPSTLFNYHHLSSKEPVNQDAKCFTSNQLKYQKNKQST